MESPSDAPAVDPAARIFSQVVFTDIPRSYSPSAAASCHYTFTAGYQPCPRDWVGIFKVGWSTTKDYHTFVWAEHSQDGQEPTTKTAVFKEYYLPKDEVEFYQFCYIDSNGQVRGASTPFSFKGGAEPSVESVPDDDTLFITTQEQIEQSIRERRELQTELGRIREECEALKRARQEQQQDAASFQRQNEQKELENIRLVMEMDEVKAQNAILKTTLHLKQQEIANLQESLLVQATKQMEIREQIASEQNKPNRSESFDGALSPHEKHLQERYDQAVLKIKQLKQEREELKGKTDAQSEEISTLHFKVREGEQELLKAQDSIHLIQVDLQCSEKEKERLSAELQTLKHTTYEMKSENQELSRRLSQQETVQSCPDANPKVPYETVVRQLQDTQAKLAAEKDQCWNSKRRADFLDKELQVVKEQVKNIAELLAQEQERSRKFELQFMEAREAIDDKDSKIEEKDHMIKLVSHEKDELAKENQNLRSNVEGLRNAYASLQETSQYMQPDTTSAAGSASDGPLVRQLDTPEQTENLYETIESTVTEEERLLVCRHCQESFPGITQNELEQHEQSHRVCPFCTMICDTMEQSVFEDHVYGHEL